MRKKLYQVYEVYIFTLLFLFFGQCEMDGKYMHSVNCEYYHVLILSFRTICHDMDLALLVYCLYSSISQSFTLLYGVSRLINLKVFHLLIELIVALL